MEALHSWVWISASPEEERSGASQGMTDPWQTGQECGWRVVKESAEESCSEGWEKVYGPEGRGECCQLTCAEGSGTGAGALVQVHVRSWVECGRSLLESLGRSSWVNCSGKSSHPLWGIKEEQ